MRAQGLQKAKMALIERSFYLLNACAICMLLLQIEQSVLVVLVCYYKDMLKKGDDANNPAILSFFFVTKRTQLNAAHA